MDCAREAKPSQYRPSLWLVAWLFSLPLSSSSRSSSNQAFGSFASRRNNPKSSLFTISSHRRLGHRILCIGRDSNERQSSFESSASCSVELSLLLQLRGGSTPSDDAAYYSSYGSPQQQPQQSSSSTGRYQEEWEIPARDRYATGRQPPRSNPPDEQQDDEYYHDRGLPTPRERQQQRGTGTSTSGNMSSKFMPSIISRGNKKIGLSLLAAGAAVTMLGISLFFNKTLMRLGNLLVIAGVPLVIGPTRTMGYFLKPQKARATACLALGIFLVFVGWPVFGIALELFGLLNLFGNMFPIFWAVAKNTPLVGNLLKQGEGRGNKAGASRRRERYYDDPEDIARRRKEEEQYY